MNTFCTHCGAALGAQDAFCTACGIGRSVQPANPDPPARDKRRWPYWLLALLLVFALGYLLGQRRVATSLPCPAPLAMNQGGTSAASAGGGGAAGRGAPGERGGSSGGSHGGGAGSVSGTSGAGAGTGAGGGGGGGTGSGNVTSQGNGGATGDTQSGGPGRDADGGGGGSAGGGGGGSGDSAGGGEGSGTPGLDAPGRKGHQDGGVDGDSTDLSGSGGNPSPGGDGPSVPTDAAHSDANDPESVARRLAGGSLQIGRAAADRRASEGPPPTTVVAHDFRYDKTGLPHYPDAVREVVSAMSTSPATPGGYGSSCAIVTSNAFDAVVDWYREHLPPGWRVQTIGDLNRLAAALSPQQLLQQLSPRAGGPSGASAGSVPDPQGEHLQVAMFSPPAGVPGNLGIMIVAKDGQPVQVLLKSRQDRS